ncbi:MAG: hypothetical protein AABW79_02815 [Nanoarchaeota archaeon]
MVKSKESQQERKTTITRENIMATLSHILVATITEGCSAIGPIEFMHGTGAKDKPLTAEYMLARCNSKGEIKVRKGVAWKITDMVYKGTDSNRTSHNLSYGDFHAIGRPTHIEIRESTEYINRDHSFT